MRQTLFLGIAAVLDAIGAFLSSIQHRYTSYACFVGAIVMVGLAIWSTYRNEYRLRQGRKELGEVLVELSQCELVAYDGTNASEYEKLLARIDKIPAKVAIAAKYFNDSSIESRFLAVNVLDVELSEATKRNFIDRAQGNFWTVYQKIKAWRICIDRMLQESRH